MNRTILTLMVAAGTTLSACGGGGGGSDSSAGNGNNNGVPSSATQSVTGLVAYLQQLIGNTSETGEPVSLEGATLPVDDAGPPLAI